MKRFSLWLFALSVASATPALAQRTPIAETNVEALQKISSAAAKDYKANRSLALKLAKEKGWVIDKIYSDGTHISLQGLDAKGLPIYYITYNNSRAAATTKTDHLWAGGSLGLSLSGSSAAVTDKLALWDGGRVRATHQELRGRVVQKDSPAETFDAHATHVAGTMMASGVNQFAKGMSHGLKSLQAYDFSNDRAEMAQAAANLLVSNHSYGTIAGWRFNSEKAGTAEDPNWEWWGDSEISGTEDYKFGYYDQTAVAWDNIAFNAPNYLIVKSAGNNRSQIGPKVNEPFYRRGRSGSFTLERRPDNISNNDGYDIIANSGTAKNILTVGAVNPIANGYNHPADVSISSFSSYGPTDDGRIKPDIVGNGVSVLSSTSESDLTYSSYNGTSMSAPNVSGTLLLLQEHYSNLNSKVMQAATLKGLAIHTADEAGSAPGPDYIYGWGLLNAAKAAKLITEAKSSSENKSGLILEQALSQSQTFQVKVVASGAGPLRFTISWTDPAGEAHPLNVAALNNRSPRLVNDLDIIAVSDSEGNNFLPWTLDPAKPAENAKRGNNSVDNVEQIMIQNPIPGQSYTVTISHKGTLKNGRQNYSLIVSGIGGTAYCSSAASSEAGANITKLVLGSYATPSFPSDACTKYRNFTDSKITFEPGQSKTLTIETGSCGTDAAKKAKAFIDWNRDGDFNDDKEEVLLAGTGPYTAAIVAPGTVNAEENILMRVVLQETSDAAVISPCGSYSRGETQDHYIQIIKQQRDIAIVNVSQVGGNLCATSDQKLQVKLKNLGAAAQTNFPITVTVKKNGLQVAQLSQVYTGTLAAFAEEEFILNGSFATEAGASYEFVAEAALEADAVMDNNRLSSTVIISSLATSPEATAFTCGDKSDYALTSNSGSSTFWYTSLTATVPIAAGNIAVPASRVGNSTSLYAATADFSATVGPASKSFASGGGYNQFGPDVLITSKAPVILESARLYIGNSGKITFTVYDMNGAPVSSRTLQVKATRTPAASGAQPDDLTDQGAVYYLGLQIPAAGDYKINISYENGATIYRNNAGVSGYPFGITDVFTITGNTANPGSTGYYYYFYDLKVKALGCKSERVAVKLVKGTPLQQPVVTIKGHTLESNEAVGNNWYLNGAEIPNAKGKTFTPTVSGIYSVKVIKDGCISEMSVSKDFVFDPAVEVGDGLTVYPNPNDGIFNFRVETAVKEDITFEVYDLMGKVLFTNSVKQKNGQYKGTIDFKPKASGIYILKVQHGSQVYTRRIVVQK